MNNLRWNLVVHQDSSESFLAINTTMQRTLLIGLAALVLGNEGAGLSADVRSAVDQLVAVPIRGAAESLNVGVAAGVLLYLLTRSR